MKIELNRKDIEEALQDYVFKKLGDTAYISGFTAINGNQYFRVDAMELNVKD